MNTQLDHLPSAINSPPKRISLIDRLAGKYNVEPDKFLAAVKATAFKNCSNEQLMTLLVVADQYGLNPWTKEIYAFPSRDGGIVPIVGVDGWARIINDQEQFDGMEFAEGGGEGLTHPDWMSCTIHRKDRAHPTTVREYFAEVNRGGGVTSPWITHPRRMLRHKVLIQCARLAFGFTGIYDQDEAERIIEAQPRDLGPRPEEKVDLAIRDKWVGQITDTLNMDKLEHEIAAALRVIADELNKAPEIYTAVSDYLAAQKIISKANWTKYLKIEAPAE